MSPLRDSQRPVPVDYPAARWTGMVASLIHIFGHINAEEYLAAGKAGAFVKKTAAGD